MKQLAALGMTPQSRARLGVKAAQIDLAQLLSAPDTPERTRLLEQAGLDPDSKDKQ